MKHVQNRLSERLAKDTSPGSFLATLSFRKERVKISIRNGYLAPFSFLKEKGWG